MIFHHYYLLGLAFSSNDEYTHFDDFEYLFFRLARKKNEAVSKVGINAGYFQSHNPRMSFIKKLIIGFICR
jgi:hypothetical protein